MFNRTVSEMANEYARWGDPNNVQAQVDAFYQYHLIFSEDLLCRPENMRNHIQSSFSLPQQVSVNLDVYPSNAGKIEISTITPNSYPWNGIYFDGIPIQLEASLQSLRTSVGQYSQNMSQLIQTSAKVISGSKKL